MAREESPAYQWFIKDARSERVFQRMSFSERGVYRDMLDQQWEDYTLPDSPEEVAEMIATTPAQVAEVHAAWPVVRRKFVSIDDQPGRIKNLRLEKCRKEYRAFIRAKKKAGKARAEAAQRNGSGVFQAASTQPADYQQTSSSEPARIQPSTATASASASASPTATAPATPTASATAGEPPPNGRSKRPIFSGQKIVVFDWMLEDCVRTLGNLLPQFDLHEWFFQLDGEAMAHNFVVPKRDGGAWLQAQLIAEARRRGLPLITEAPPNKQMAALQHAGREFLQ